MFVQDDELSRAVADELDWDPRIDSSAITVSATGGTVTLTGAVASCAEKREATRGALRVRGVDRVDDALTVRLLEENRIDDGQLDRFARLALGMSSLVPSTIHAAVEDAWVTLTGTANAQFQRAEAEDLMMRLTGVRGITNDVVLVPIGRDASTAADRAICRALERVLGPRAAAIDVETDGGVVTLDGTVGSRSEHDMAIASTWNGPGVVKVSDHLEVR